MVDVESIDTIARTDLSVLALSSRFDGPLPNPQSFISRSFLSVLALSSRFDGPVHCLG